ncbi:MAG: UPF0175 family protein [Defluviitaleaceae bacterium]|nr:UPF0175 family protein [Defluviitaleaceae bacterium]
MSVATSICIPKSVLLSLRQPVETVGLDMKRALAMRYYDEKRLSLGQCAELAEMNEKSFIGYLSRYGISIFNFESQEELLEDIRNA